jgi:hypothetical protein
MNFQYCSDDELHLSSLKAADAERADTLRLLKHLIEIEKRHLYSNYECSSLHAYCVKYLKMSDPQAGRRVSASRLLRELPTIEEKVVSGSLTLTSVCQASSFFKKEAHAGNKIDLAKKLEILGELNSNPDFHIRESVKRRTEKLTEIKIVVDDELLSQLDRLKEIWSHALPGASYTQIIMRLASTAVAKFGPQLKAECALVRSTAKKKRSIKVSANSKVVEGVIHRSRNIPAEIRRDVWTRDRGRCTFVNEKSGEVCEARHFIEFDHIIPFVADGEHSVKNLRLRCRAHNHRHSVETFGEKSANAWRH